MGRKRKDAQTFIPGTEPPSIKEIDLAADAYREIRDQRMQLNKQEKELNLKLTAVLMKHELTAYEFDGYIASIVTGKTKARVRSNSNGDGDDEEEDEDDDE